MKRFVVLFALVAVGVGLLTACGQDEADGDLKKDVVENYAAGVHHLYSTSLNSAIALDASGNCPGRIN